MSARNTTILLIEDETAIAEIVVDYLLREGFKCLHQTSGSNCVEIIKQQHIDLVLLDVMLPGEDGFEICKTIRKYLSTPIIMLTARVEEIDRLIGLELGADDYICKPFSPREVVARVKAILRRGIPAHPESSTAITSSSKLFDINADSLTVRISGKKIDFTISEFKLFSALASRPGKIWSREQLLNVFAGEKNVFDRTIDSHIKNIRKKIQAVINDREFIESVYGVGYRLEV